MNELTTFVDASGRQAQLFNGVKYILGQNDFYFRGPNGRRLHTVIYEHYYGIRSSRKSHVHHKDGNKHNNMPENLELKPAGSHIGEHMREWIKEDPSYFQWLAKQGQAAAAAWSKTPEGRAFRQRHAKEVLLSYMPVLMRKIDKICDQCSNPYQVPYLGSGSSRFCSNKCKSAYRRKMGFDDIDKVCSHCQKSYRCNKYSKQIFCSRVCRQKRGH